MENPECFFCGEQHDPFVQCSILSLKSRIKYLEDYIRKLQTKEKGVKK